MTSFNLKFFNTHGLTIIRESNPIPSGYVKIAIENGYRNSGFSH
jgi:hypothetical protein